MFGQSILFQLHLLYYTPPHLHWQHHIYVIMTALAEKIFVVSLLLRICLQLNIHPHPRHAIPPGSRLAVNIVHIVLPPDNKVTYHDVFIGNARSSTTKDDIRKPLMSMDVHKIGNIIPLCSNNMSTTAFSVFIADQHIDTNVYNSVGTETLMLSHIVCAEQYTFQTYVSESLNSKPIDKTHQTSARTMYQTDLGVVLTPVYLVLPVEFLANVRPALIPPQM